MIDQNDFFTMLKSKTNRLITLVLIIHLFSYTSGNAQSDFGVWSGSIRKQEKFVGATGHSETQVIITIIDNRATGTVKQDGELIMSGMKWCSFSCSGSGPAELHNVIIDRQDSYYRIEAISPKFTCNNTGLRCEGGATTEMHKIDVGTSDRPLDNNPNVLVGSETRVSDIVGMGTQTTTVTWNLVRSTNTNAELIVTPENYDRWLPEPGISEYTEGKTMNISLKVQGVNGRPLTSKVKQFEVRLNNTSHEPGLTINYPLRPESPSLGDIRFLPQSSGAIDPEGQNITITCSGCLSANVKIGSFDGGGYTTLTATALLEDGSRITGHLLVPTGETEVRIPKRDANSSIATYWLNANGDPGDMDDDETSRGNNNNGDGLTAYEEYRGVLSEGAFKRLNPKKKEIGIKLKRSELTYFGEALDWFKAASDIDVVRFFTYEIGSDRALNKNHQTAHDYDQFALVLTKGSLRKGFLGMVYTTTDGPDIPKRTEKVVFDIDNIRNLYQFILRRENGHLPYTEQELLSKTVAHELSHAVNIWHHGDPPQSEPSPQEVTANALYEFHVIDRLGNEIFTRPYLLEGGIGRTGNQESGDLSCLINYNPVFNWARQDINGAGYFYRVPLVGMGRGLCNSKVGTDINAPRLSGQNKYFGNATLGNCLSQIKLKE